MNFQLLRAIKEKGLTQREFARLVGDHESVVSRIITGTWNPSAIKKVKHAKLLDRKVSEIFK